MNASPLDMAEMTARDDPEGPGSQLREARHRANLSLEEVSTALHLNADTVRALEDDRFDGLPAPAFVRGYIRSYARLLRLPPGPVLEAYDSKGFTPPNIVADIAQEPQAKSTDVPVRLATYLVAAGLVVMVAMWWQSQEVPPAPLNEIAQAPSAGAPTGSGPPLGGAPSAPSSATDVRTVRGGADGRAPQGGDDLASLPAPVGPLAAVREATALPADPAPPMEEEPAVPDAPTSPITDDDRVAAAEAEAADPDDSATETALAEDSAGGNAGTARLDLAFDRESWLEVYDHGGDRLAYRLAAEGDRLTLNAVPPIRVVLGYAAGARISLNQRAIDFSPFMDRGMARFIVGADGAVRSVTAESGNGNGPATAATVSDLRP